MLRGTGGIAIASWVLTSLAAAQIGTVERFQKINESSGGFGGILHRDWFGQSVTPLGDVNGDGTMDLAVGALFDYDGGVVIGSVWILFLNPDGTVASEQKIGATAGGFGPGLHDGDHFGVSVASLGDLDGDGVVDIAVGAEGDDDGGVEQGAVWILFLNSDGTVSSKQKISETSGGFGGDLEHVDIFGTSLAALGDVNGDGSADLAVGAPYAEGGGTAQGVVWILFLNPDGTVAAEQEISEVAGGFGGVLDSDDYFGSALAAVGDLDGNGITELAVGADHDDDGGHDAGAVWMLFLDPAGTVVAEQKISETAGGFSENISPNVSLGCSLAGIGDFDGDGVPDLAAGAIQHDDGGLDRGAIWLLFLQPDGTVESQQKISSTAGDFDGDLDDYDLFGSSIASLGDLDGDGFDDIVVGAVGDDDDETNQGALWMLFLEGDTLAPVLSCPPVARRSDPPGKVVFFSVASSDDVDPAPSVTCVPPSGSFFPLGTTMVTCTAEDRTGNQSVCVFPVIVVPRIVALDPPVPGGR